jgi:hypothetical protein
MIFNRPMSFNVMHASKREELRVRLKTVLLAGLLLATTWVHPTQAGVEFVTRTTDCTKVDVVGDGKDLFIMAGQNVRFRVFGNSVDLSDPNTGFRIRTDSGVGNVNARIISQGQDCGAVGFALVEIDSPSTITSLLQRSLHFKMPLGDWSRLQISIRRWPAINAVWSAAQNLNCIGGVQLLNQDKTLRITLPPGHLNDDTTCNNRTARARVVVGNIGEVDIFNSPFIYPVFNIPNFMTSNQVPTNPNPAVGPTIEFPIDVAAIRHLETETTRTITVNSVPNRSSTLTLNVKPNTSNGFTQDPACRNVNTGELVNVNDQVHCEFRLAQAVPSGGQNISFEVVDKNCVTGAGSTAYSQAIGKGSIMLNGSGSNVFDIPLLTARGGTSSQGTPCASQTGVQVTVRFWVGAQDTSIPDGQDTFRIKKAL